MTVTPTEHNAEFASTPATGLCAMLRGLFRVNGIGASSRRPARMVVAAVSIALLCLACSSAPASAVFTRPFLKAICSGQLLVGWLSIRKMISGCATVRPNSLSSVRPLRRLNRTSGVADGCWVWVSPGELAIEQSSGHLYEVVGEAYSANDGLMCLKARGRPSRVGKTRRVRWWPSGGTQTGVQVAVDNNPASDFADPSACGVPGCVVYVVHAGHDPKAPLGDGLPAGIEKLNSSGAEVAVHQGRGRVVVRERQRDHGHAVRIVREHRSPEGCGGGCGGRHLRVCRRAGCGRVSSEW